MNKKFTEEEYQKIVEVADQELNKTGLIALIKLQRIYERVQESASSKEHNHFRDMNQELALIALPKSRDWAHDQFVEKEKKYGWQLKPLFDDDDEIYLKEYENGIIGYTINSNHASPLTESKVREWGYNPDMFDREEVE
ncbi:hypothetical protein [Fructobacillus cardui]|uniref:hypothetical protein n=1 Tax=Fructobacillus cardui TaxID=2893170 RepID=UPI002D9A2778|nr:hypothetical protein R53653_IHELHDKM_01455 [Fructobacillus cardui]